MVKPRSGTVCYVVCEYIQICYNCLILVGSIRLSCQHLALVNNYLPCTIKMLSTSGIRMSYCKSQYNISKPGELHHLQTLICGTEYLLVIILPTNLQFQKRYNSELCKQITQLSMRPKCRGLV